MSQYFSELFTVYGVTDASSATGDIPLFGPFFVLGDGSGTGLGYIRMPKGGKLKVWAIRISGANVTFKVNYTTDVTAGSVTWTTLAQDKYDITIDGTYIDNKARPLVFESATGDEAVKFSWADSAPANTSFEIVIEICKE